MTYIIRRALTYSVYFLPVVTAQYTPSPRWGQAVALLESTLYIHGGLSDPFNSYSYSSAPGLPELLQLDLSKSFNSSSPPWELLSSAISPALSWHILSAFNPAELLLFGGQPNPNSQPSLTTLSDSAGLLDTTLSNPYLLMEPQNWGNQPMRRIRHSASFSNGKVWIIGGEKADGSGNAFNEHYYFDPSESYFIQLPSSTNAPPDIYGHASLVLPDGRILVLGGYCASCSKLVPMNTVWLLNTTQISPSWDQLSTSTETLPSPRRDFAAAVLPNGKILVHGGGDAGLLMTYSDGWLLDTSRNPMVWQSLEQLAQLGQRKDHFAVQLAGYVFFSFGYGPSSPASASLFIYDSTTSSMVSSYTAPAPGSTPAMISFPVPSQTGDASNPSSSSSATGSSASPTYPSSSSLSNNHTTAIALGTVFGVLGLVAGGLATMYYTKRVRGRTRTTGCSFRRLGDGPGVSSDDESVAHTAPRTRQPDDLTNERGRIFSTSSAIPDILTHLGISNKPPQPRRDMFADEDTRSFGGGHSSALWRDDSESNSAWSFRTMSALVRGMITREPSGCGADEEAREWEKIDHPYGEDQEGLIRQANILSESSSAPSHRGEDSLWSYTDPFEDPHSEDDYDSRPGIPEEDADYDRPIQRNRGIHKYDSTALRPPDAPFSFSAPSRLLTPVIEVSHTSLSEPSNSLPSLHPSFQEESTHDHSPNSLNSLRVTIPQTTGPSSPTAAHSSDTSPVATSPRYSSILHPSSPTSQVINSSDSWWSRFAKTPLLDRRSSVSQRPLDFRDPTPAPPIILVEESQKPSSVQTGSTATPIEHDRSVSSAHSARTANTDSAEHLGANYDVVQRFASDGSSSRRVPSLASAEITEQGVLGSGPLESDVSALNKLPPTDPPRSTSPKTDLGDAITPPSGVVVPPTSPTKGGIVSNRISAYERRTSQEIETQQSPPPRNTRKREEILSRSRPTIKYGVAPRASLFIANPDSGHHS